MCIRDRCQLLVYTAPCTRGIFCEMNMIHGDLHLFAVMIIKKTALRKLHFFKFEFYSISDAVQLSEDQVELRM